MQCGYIKTLDDSSLYVVFHSATLKNGESFTPVVIAPPLFEERKSAYNSLRRLAECLAAAGHSVLRFDYRGSGESGGHLARRRWQHLAEDLMVACQTLKKMSGHPNCLLLGLRLGATLTLQQSNAIGVAGVIALAPIIVGASQARFWKVRSKIRAELTEMRAISARLESSRRDRENISESRNEILNNEEKIITRAPNTPADVIDFDGYEVSPAFFNDVSAIDLITDLRPLSKPCCLVQISPRVDAAPENAQLHKALGANAKLEILRMEPFWNKLDDVDTQPLEDLVLKIVASG